MPDHEPDPLEQAYYEQADLTQGRAILAERDELRAQLKRIANLADNALQVKPRDLKDCWVRVKQIATEDAAQIDADGNEMDDTQVVDLVAALERAILAERDELRVAKDGAYSERDQLVAWLSALFPAWLERHPDEDTEWEDDWRWIVFIDHPTAGQMTWHIHDSELPLFDHLTRSNAHRWDGHTTEMKYERVRDAREDAAREGGE